MQRSHSPAPPGHWRCVQCTYINEDDRLACSECNTKRPSQNESVWRCGHCDFDNSESDSHCMMCRNPRPPSSSPHPPPPDDDDPDFHDDSPSNQWVCRICTFQNHPRFESCNVCGEDRRSCAENMTLGAIRYDEESEFPDEIENEDWDFGGGGTTIEDFEIALQVILTLINNPTQAVHLLKALLKISERVSDENPKYRRLDTRSRGVQTRLLNYEGTLEYLHLLGFVLEDNMMLVCQRHPPQHVLDSAVDLIKKNLNRMHNKNHRHSSLHGDHLLRGARGSGHDDASSASSAIFVSIHRRKDGRVPVERRDDGRRERPPPPPKRTPGDSFPIGSGDETDENLDMHHDDASANFSLDQLVLITTHESLEDVEAGRLMLLVHKCFSSSMELFDALMTRYWSCQDIDDRDRSRRIQTKVVYLLTSWIDEYYIVDFLNQRELHLKLDTFLSRLRSNHSSSPSTFDSQMITDLQTSITNARNKYEMEEKEEKENAVGASSPERSRERILENCSADEFAEQLTLKDFSVFERIHARELLNKVWKGSKKKKKKKEENEMRHLSAMIDRFNCISRYVGINILSARGLNERSEKILFFIQVARRLLILRNYFSTMAVFAALDGVWVAKLKFAWKRVPAEHQRIFDEELRKVCSSKGNFANLREKVTKKVRRPAIPYIGLILQDLTMVNDGSASKSSEYERFINWKKFENFEERVRFVSMFQEQGYENLMVNERMQSEMTEDLKVFSKLKDANFKTLVRQANAIDEGQATGAEKREIEKEKKRREKERSIGGHGQSGGFFSFRR